jgi:DNA-binding NarL/FixJ family response regulator
VGTVCVCDDSPLAREALCRSLDGLPGVDRVVLAATGEEVLARWPNERPDLVLMDVRMPGLGGVEATRRLLARHPGAAVIMMTVAEDVDGVAHAVHAGARGYLVKGASREELAVIVAHALARPHETAAVALSGTVGMAAGRRPAVGQGAPPLTEREMQVLTGMSRGRSNAEIGRELYLSEDTVKTHARRLFRKLGAADRAHAVAVGFRAGLVR